MDKVYGPYKRKSDGRWIIIVNGETISYPRYLYEKHHNCTIAIGYEVDHIDDDFDNNNIDNLQLLTKTDNIKKHHSTFVQGRGYRQTEEQKRSGEKNGMALLTQEQVEKYRKMPRIHGFTIPLIMKETKMSRKSVYNLLEGISYK